MKDSVLADLIFKAEQKALGKGYSVTMPISGWSMFPLLTHKDKITIVSCKGKELFLGDIVLFQERGLIVHRIIKKTKNENGLVFFTKGDSLFRSDNPILEKAIIGQNQLRARLLT